MRKGSDQGQEIDRLWEASSTFSSQQVGIVTSWNLGSSPMISCILELTTACKDYLTLYVLLKQHTYPAIAACRFSRESLNYNVLVATRGIIGRKEGRMYVVMVMGQTQLFSAGTPGRGTVRNCYERQARFLFESFVDFYCNMIPKEIIGWMIHEQIADTYSMALDEFTVVLISVYSPVP
ncbi:unnamed protein product [Thelazia callipaeda]|uniref:Cauli_VI domain-containing protein n=1 Tax=Thelazia callipaeda TaxID=103827 RepID=A0A0N5D187_THECL|nr:unnamed protein product [Thelazia callipaeda]